MPLHRCSIPHSLSLSFSRSLILPTAFSTHTKHSHLIHSSLELCCAVPCVCRGVGYMCIMHVLIAVAMLPIHNTNRHILNPKRKQKKKKEMEKKKEEQKNVMHAKQRSHQAHANTVCKLWFAKFIGQNNVQYTLSTGHIVHQDGRVAKMNAYTMLHIKIHYTVGKQRAENVNNNVAIWDYREATTLLHSLSLSPSRCPTAERNNNLICKRLHCTNCTQLLLDTDGREKETERKMRR